MWKKSEFTLKISLKNTVGITLGLTVHLAPKNAWRNIQAFLIVYFVLQLNHLYTKNVKG
jgi:hypothetical protein